MKKAKNTAFQDRFRELVGADATQEEIALKVHSSRQNVGNWLGGKTKPDIYALAEIAKGYGVSTDYLLGLTDIKTINSDIQAVCKYTGLSEKGVNNVVKIHSEYTIGFDEINRFFEGEKLIKAASVIEGWNSKIEEDLRELKSEEKSLKEYEPDDDCYSDCLEEIESIKKEIEFFKWVIRKNLEDIIFGKE